MSEPEFVGPGVAQPPLSSPPSVGEKPTRTLHNDPPPDGNPAVSVASVVLLLLASGGCVLASFRTVYGVRFATGSLPGSHVDGWGRFPSTSTTLGGEHGVRYGIALVAVAAALVVLAVLRVATSLAPSGPIAGVERPARVLGLVSIGALIGVLASAALEAESAINTFRIQIRAELLDTADQSSTTKAAHAYYGSLLWVGAAAAGCAIIAVALPRLVVGINAIVRRRAPDTEDGGGDDGGPAVVHADDETLSTRRGASSGKVSGKPPF